MRLWQNNGRRILIVNLHSSRNAGDDVLTRVTVQELEKNFPAASLVLAMNDPDSYEGMGVPVGSFMSWWRRGDGSWQLGKLFTLIPLSLFALIGRKRILRGVSAPYRPLLRAYFEADLVISSAGNFLYSSGRFGITLWIAIFTMGYAVLLGKPLYLMPQTIGPITRQWERRLVAWIVGRARLVFVRDAISRDFLREIQAWGAHCRLAPDLAFALEAAPQQQGRALLAANEVEARGHRPWLGVTLINWEAQFGPFKRQAAYETAVAEAIRHFINVRKGYVVLFAQVCGPTRAEDDRVPTRRIYKQLADVEERITFIESDPSPMELKAAYGLMDLFIGTRLHSNIFALSENVPAVLIQYQYKTRGIARMLDLEKWVLEIESVTGEQLCAALDQLWMEHDQIQAHIQKTMQQVQTQIAQIGPTIVQDFRQRRHG